MSVRIHFKNCPECGSDDIFEMFRCEAGEIWGSDEDFAAYQCRDCNAEFDYVTHPNAPEVIKANAELPIQHPRS